MEKERKIITDKLVRQLTHKSMEEWFVLLDEKGAREMKHAAIFKLVAATRGLEPLGQWNQNLLATTYEWDRGLKQRGQKEGGFEISVSRTLNVPAALLYKAWADDTLRERWLPNEQFYIRKATENKSLRITWSDGQTHVSLELYPKGDRKTQAVVQHMKIGSADRAATLKQFWAQRLEALKTLVS